MIHHLDGKCESQRYDLEGKGINSIDRGYLNDLLIDEIEKQENIKLEFGKRLVRMDLADTPALTFTSDETRYFDFVVGADGVFSRVRQELQKFTRMDYSQRYIDCAYLELSIAPGNEDDKFRIDKNHLHIWPRHNFMLIALPNLDGSFTSTFFAPWSIIESLDSDERVLELFRTEFPDAVPLITEEKLLYAFRNHPRGKLLSVMCNPYHFEDKCLIIGDAAHAMVPFYGQGMNCGFEDVNVLLSLLNKHEKDLAGSFEEYSQSRHKDLVAIVELAEENYKEMSHKVTSKLFLVRKQIDFLLTYFLRDKWIPLYTMVSFRSDIPYSTAVQRVERQDKILKVLQSCVVGAIGAVGFQIWRYLQRK
jgi:kynurenine 3-monooxygenase